MKPPQKTMLIVHGTGVRNKAYKATYEAVEKECGVDIFAFADLRLQRCYWGDQCGVKLPPDPKSVPKYRHASGPPTSQEQEIARWLSLFCDPFFELRQTLQLCGAWKYSKEKPQPPCKDLQTGLKRLSLSAEVTKLLERYTLQSAWDQMIISLSSNSELGELLDKVSSKPIEINPVVARMLVSEMLIRAEDEQGIVVDGSIRDRLVELVIDILGGRTAGILDVFRDSVKTIGGIVLSPVIRWRTRARRSDLTDVSTPIAGDILAYQGRRGEAFRSLIAQQIKNTATKQVVLLAHSLGGIACVELLIQEDIPQVSHLITIGSQAPFFYEMDALNTLKYGQALPSHFPRRWLNVFDPHDILAYKAENVFPESIHVSIKDLEVDSGQPFPQSHSGYWTNKDFWKECAQFIKTP